MSWIWRINPHSLIVRLLCISQPAPKNFPFSSTSLSHLTIFKLGFEHSLILNKMGDEVWKTSVAYPFPWCPSIFCFSLFEEFCYDKIYYEMVKAWKRGITWFPREGTLWCTIHWASTTPIFSWAGCFKIPSDEFRGKMDMWNITHASENVSYLHEHIFLMQNRDPNHEPSHSTISMREK